MGKEKKKRIAELLQQSLLQLSEIIEDDSQSSESPSPKKKNKKAKKRKLKEEEAKDDQEIVEKRKKDDVNEEKENLSRVVKSKGKKDKKMNEEVDVETKKKKKKKKGKRKDDYASEVKVDERLDKIVDMLSTITNSNISNDSESASKKKKKKKKSKSKDLEHVLTPETSVDSEDERRKKGKVNEKHDDVTIEDEDEQNQEPTQENPTLVKWLEERRKRREKERKEKEKKHKREEYERMRLEEEWLRDGGEKKKKWKKAKENAYFARVKKHETASESGTDFEEDPLNIKREKKSSGGSSTNIKEEHGDKFNLEIPVDPYANFSTIIKDERLIDDLVLEPFPEVDGTELRNTFDAGELSYQEAIKTIKDISKDYRADVHFGNIRKAIAWILDQEVQVSYMNIRFPMKFFTPRQQKDLEAMGFNPKAFFTQAEELELMAKVMKLKDLDVIDNTEAFMAEMKNYTEFQNCPEKGQTNLALRIIGLYLCQNFQHRTAFACVANLLRVFYKSSGPQMRLNRKVTKWIFDEDCLLIKLVLYSEAIQG